MTADTTTTDTTTAEATDESATAGTDSVVLTDTAAVKVKTLLDQEGRDDLALRVAVQPVGRKVPFDRELSGLDGNDVCWRGQRIDVTRKTAAIIERCRDGRAPNDVDRPLNAAGLETSSESSEQ